MTSGDQHRAQATCLHPGSRPGRQSPWTRPSSYLPLLRQGAIHDRTGSVTTVTLTQGGQTETLRLHGHRATTCPTSSAATAGPATIDLDISDVGTSPSVDPARRATRSPPRPRPSPGRRPAGRQLGRPVASGPAQPADRPGARSMRRRSCRAAAPGSSAPTSHRTTTKCRAPAATRPATRVRVDPAGHPHRPRRPAHRLGHVARARCPGVPAWSGWAPPDRRRGSRPGAGPAGTRPRPSPARRGVGGQARPGRRARPPPGPAPAGSVVLAHVDPVGPDGRGQVGSVVEHERHPVGGADPPDEAGPVHQCRRRRGACPAAARRRRRRDAAPDERLEVGPVRGAEVEAPTGRGPSGRPGRRRSPVTRRWGAWPGPRPSSAA